MAMTVQNYRQALKDALEERARLLAEKNAKEVRISQLNQTIYMLRKLCGDPLDVVETETGDKGSGVTGIVRNVLRSTSEPLGSLDIKNKLAEMGFPVKGKNPQAAIHTILRRLHKQGEITKVGSAGSTKWSWRVVN